jgi:hypothetical protein
LIVSSSIDGYTEGLTAVLTSCSFIRIEGRGTEGKTIVCGETWMRVYSDKDVELLKQVKRHLGEGYKLQWAFEKASEDLRAE